MKQVRCARDVKLDIGEADYSEWGIRIRVGKQVGRWWSHLIVDWLFVMPTPCTPLYLLFSFGLLSG